MAKSNASRLAEHLKLRGGLSGLARSEALNAYDQRGGSDDDESLYWSSHENTVETLHEYGLDFQTAKGQKDWGIAERAYNRQFKKLFGKLPDGV